MNQLRDRLGIPGDTGISAIDILERIHQCIMITDTEGKIVFWNKGAENIFGYTPDEIVGMKGMVLYPSYQRQDFYSDLKNIKKGEKISGPWLGRHKNGSRIWIDLIAQRLKTRNGEIAGILISACDMKSQMQAEEELKETEAWAKTILETTVDGIITINVNGIIQSFNKAAERIFGYKEDEVLGENVNMLMPSPHHERHDQYINNYLRTGKKKVIGIGREVRGKRKDGSTFPMELAVSEVTWGKEKIFTGSVKDISERRTLENEILEIGDEERRRIGQDLHDGLGQMLTGIGLMSQNLVRKMEANGIPGAEELQEITDMIKEADRFARTLSHNLIPVEVDAGGLKNSIEQLCRRARKLFNISCDFDHQGDTNMQSQNISIHLYRIAQEAISNAVKHGNASRVEVSLKGDRNGVRLVITDNGIGFPDDEELKEVEGMGIHTMRYRAHISGGELRIKESETYTMVECEIPFFEMES